MYFSDLNNGWIVGDAGKVIKTTNSGINWNFVTNSGINPNERSKTVFFLDANTGWISSKNEVGLAYIQHTTDGGASWETQGTPYNNQNDGNSIFSIYFVDAQNGWFAWVFMAKFVSIKLQDQFLESCLFRKFYWNNRTLQHLTSSNYRWRAQIYIAQS